MKNKTISERALELAVKHINKGLQSRMSMDCLRCPCLANPCGANTKNCAKAIKAHFLKLASKPNTKGGK